MKAVFLTLALMLAVASAGFSQYYTSGEWTYTLNASNEATITGYSGSGGAVVIPSSIDGNPVTAIGGLWGNYDQTITDLTIPNSVKVIEDRGCAGLTALTNLVMGDGVTEIGYRGFYESGLESVTIGKNVVSIYNQAFTGFTRAPKRVFMPNTVAHVAWDAFPGRSDWNSSIEIIVDDTALPSNPQFVNALATNDAFITALANKIVAALPNNYGIATKSDLGTAVSNAISQTVSQVQANPNEYSLFSADQNAANYSSGVTAGTSSVIANPASYNLYTSNSIMDLRMGGAMLQKQGNNAVVTFQPQTTTDLAQPFTNTGTPITNTIPMPGDKGFLRIQAR